MRPTSRLHALRLHRTRRSGRYPSWHTFPTPARNSRHLLRPLGDLRLGDLRLLLLGRPVGDHRPDNKFHRRRVGGFQLAELRSRRLAIAFRAQLVGSGSVVGGRATQEWSADERALVNEFAKRGRECTRRSRRQMTEVAECPCGRPLLHAMRALGRPWRVRLPQRVQGAFGKAGLILFRGERATRRGLGGSAGTAKPTEALETGAPAPACHQSLGPGGEDGRAQPGQSYGTDGFGQGRRAAAASRRRPGGECTPPGPGQRRASGRSFGAAKAAWAAAAEGTLTMLLPQRLRELRCCAHGLRDVALLAARASDVGPPPLPLPPAPLGISSCLEACRPWTMEASRTSTHACRSKYHWLLWDSPAVASVLLLPTILTSSSSSTPASAAAPLPALKCRLAALNGARESSVVIRHRRSGAGLLVPRPATGRRQAAGWRRLVGDTY